jgi:hypothetical protein
MLDTSFNRVIATSLKGYSKVITDNITSKQVVLWKLGQLGGIETRPGSTSIVEPVILDTNPTVKSYSGYDPLDTSVSAGITAAEYAWKQIAGTTGLSGIEKFKNSGQATQVINLWDAVGKQLALSMRKVVNTQLFGDGTGNGGKDITGLLAAVENGDAWSTYGEIDSNANTNWRNQFIDTGNVTAGDAAAIALFRAGMTSLVNACLGGGDRPHLIVTTQTMHEFWENKILQPNEHYERVSADEDMARSGFTNFIFKGVPVVWDEDMQPNTTGDDNQGMVALNLDYMKFVMGEGYEFSFTDPIRPDNQDAETVQCLFYGNLVLSNRRRQGRNDIHGA